MIGHSDRRQYARLATVLALAIAFHATQASAQQAKSLPFAGEGHTNHGDWRATGSISRDSWRPGQYVEASVELLFDDAHLAGLAAAGIKADKLCLLVTAERTFDADGCRWGVSENGRSDNLAPSKASYRPARHLRRGDHVRGHQGILAA